MTQIIYQKLTVEGPIKNVNKLVEEMKGEEDNILYINNIIKEGYEYLYIDNRIYRDWYKENRDKLCINIITEYISIENILEYISLIYKDILFRLLFYTHDNLVFYGEITYKEGLLIQTDQPEERYIKKQLEIDSVNEGLINSLIYGGDSIDPFDYSMNGSN